MFYSEAIVTSSYQDIYTIKDRGEIIPVLMFSSFLGF